MLCEEMLRAYPASPGAPGWHVHAGHVALKGHELPAAREHFQAVVTRAAGSPYYMSALVGLGDVTFEAGDCAEAARHYARASPGAARPMPPGGSITHAQGAPNRW